MDERGNWTLKEETNTHRWDKNLTGAIVSMFKEDVDTIADIGCGDGSYTSTLLGAGFMAFGFDGSPLTTELTNGFCKQVDFSYPQYIGRYDLVLSLEVGEHIPKEYEQAFIDNICRTAIRYVCLSWATPGQGGTGHVNCQWNGYVVDEMKKRGFVYDLDKSKILRKASTLPWFKNTLMVFYHE